MSLRTKIAGSFTVVSMVVITLLLAVIYSTSRTYTREEFYRRLEERAQLYAFIMLEKDEMSPESYNEILERQKIRIESEIDILLSVNRLDTLTTDLGFDKAELKQIEQERIHRGVSNNEFWVAIFYPDNEGDFIIISKAQDIYGDRKLKHLGLILLIIAVVYTLSIYFIGRFYARITLRPLDRLIQQIKSLDYQRVDQRLPVNSKEEEVQNLARAFNSQLDNVETAIESQNNFISHASHELKNPLTAILGEIETSREQSLSQEEFRDSLRRIGQEAEKINLITLRLLKLAQTSFGDEQIQREFYVDEVLFEVIENWKDQTQRKRIQLSIKSEEVDHEIFKFIGNIELIEIAITNIIDNALKFSDDRVDISLCVEDGVPYIQVRDYGIGIPENAIGDIYKPFFRAENARIKPGFGIGLPLTKKIMDMHQFQLFVESKVPGTSFKLYFGAK